MFIDKFKNIFNKGGEQEEVKVVDIDETEPKTQSPAEPVNTEEQDEKTLFDEMLGAPQYTYEEFLAVLKAPQEERGDTEELRKHWGYPRRWKVVLWDLQIQNYMNNFNAFVDFDFGGNREECRIQRGTTLKIYAKGKTKNSLRTKVVSNVVAEERKNMNFRNVFEYRGSYLDLENEKLRIKVWEYKQFTLNKLEGIYEEPLISFAVGEVYNETTLYKFIKDTRIKRCRLYFQLYFQELYDFELSFLNWSFSDLLSVVTMQHRSFVYLLEKDKNKKRFGEEATCSAFSFLCGNKNIAKYKKMRRSLKGNESLNKDFSFKTAMSEDESNLDQTEVSKNMEELFFRNLSLIQNADEADEFIMSEDKELMLPNPRVTIKLIHTPKGSKGLNLVSLEQKRINYPIWENLGEIYFRGTLRDLDVSYLNIKVEDMSAPKAIREIGCCQIPLKGVVDYPYIMHELEPPSWLIEEAKSEGWHKKLEEWKIGSLEGKVIIARVPRYRQIGDIYHVDNKHYYLIVNILNIDQIVTVDNIKELDTYVEVTFDETSRRTRLMKKSLTPNYDSLLAIPLRFNNKSEVNYQNFAKKGRIYIDVWGKTEDPIYVGGTTVNPHDIFFNEKNITRATVKLEHIDLETNVKTNYDTIVYKGSRKLNFIHDDHKVSNIYFSIWTYPNMLGPEEKINVTTPPPFNTTRNFPSKLAEKYERLKSLYIDVLKTINAIPQTLINIETAKRFFSYELCNQRKEYHFLPTLLTSIKSPYLAESENAVFHYVRCIPFIHKKDNIAFTPDFTLQLKGGNAIDHCLLLCSLFLGVPVVAFVCFGTLWDNQKHCWVATFEVHAEKNYGLVKFWETTTGNVYVLKKRFADFNKLKAIEIKLNESKYKAHLRDGFLHKQKKNYLDKNTVGTDARAAIKQMLRGKKEGETPEGGPLLPYKTIDLIFNNKNIYVNLQNADPLHIWYDFWRFDLWYPFTSVEYKIQPCFTIKSFTHKMEDMELDKIAKELRSNIEKNITIFRASRNLSTRWNRDETLELFLQIGLELLHQLNTSRNEDTLLAKVKIEDWKKALYYKVPHSHRLLGFPYHFNTCKPKFISDKLISTLAILESRDRSLCLSFAVCVYSLPGDFISVYVYIITCVKITQRELRKMEIAKEKAQRKADHKKIKQEKALQQTEGKTTVNEELQPKIEEIKEEVTGEMQNELENEDTFKIKNKKSKTKDKKKKKKSITPLLSNELELFEAGNENKKDNISSIEGILENAKKETEDLEGEIETTEKNNENEFFQTMEQYTDVSDKYKAADSKENKTLMKKHSIKKSKTKELEEINERFFEEEKKPIENKTKGENEDKFHEKKKNISFKDLNNIDSTENQDHNEKLSGTLKKKKKKKKKDDKERKHKKKSIELAEASISSKSSSKEILALQREEFEKEKKRLQEDMEKLLKEKEEFKKQRLLREENEKQRLLEEKKKLEKEKEQFEKDRIKREKHLLIKKEKMEKQMEKKIKEKIKENEKTVIQKILEKEEEEKKKLKEEREALKQKLLEKELEIEKEKQKEIEKEKEKETERLKIAWMEQKKKEEIKKRIEEEKKKKEEEEQRKKKERQREAMERERRKMESFEEEIDLNQIYINSPRAYAQENKRYEKKTIRLSNRNRVDSDISSDPREKKKANIYKYRTNDENIAKLLLKKTANDSLGVPNYNYNKPHYGNSSKYINSYEEMKNEDLFKGFIEESKPTKKIVLVKKKK